MSTIRRTSGFTIVELLIVIVIIAILAAITVVAYNGIQDRAETSKTISVVKAYQKALTLYRTSEGSYPVAGAMCLGDQYPAFSGGTNGACRYSTSQINDEGNAAGRNLLLPYLGGQLPMPSTNPIHSGTTEFVGAHFYGSGYNLTLDGINNPVVMIEYYVKADTCPVGPVYAGTGWPNLSSPAVERSAALSDGSRCYLVMSDS